MNKEKQEEKRLLKSFVCSLAMRLYDEESVSIKEAFRRAHLARELLEQLGQGKVTFQYEKQNGDLREAMGTLRWGIDPTTPTRPPQGEDSVTPSRRRRREPDSLNFTYWDLEKHGFRTFSAARIVKIIAVAIPNYKEVVEHVSPDLIEFV
jgi:hypothetical protein